MKSKKLGVIGAILFCAIGLASCQTPYHEDGERYVFVATNVNLPYWQEAQAGLTDAAKQMGVKAEAQGIPVITVDSDAPTSKRVMFVGTDNFRAGGESAKRIADILKGTGQLVVITIPGQLNLDERARGMNDVLKKYPGIKLAQTIDDNGDPRVANDNISALLKAKAKIDGIICLEASGGSGAAEALHRLDVKIPIVGFDKDPETLDWIDRDVISATVTQKPYVMAYYALKFADDLHHNAVHDFKDWRTAPAPPMPTFVDTGTAVVDKSNAKVFREALAAHPKPL